MAEMRGIGQEGNRSDTGVRHDILCLAFRSMSALPSETGAVAWKHLIATCPVHHHRRHHHHHSMPQHDSPPHHSKTSRATIACARAHTHLPTPPAQHQSHEMAGAKVQCSSPPSKQLCITTMQSTHTKSTPSPCLPFSLPPWHSPLEPPELSTPTLTNFKP